MDEMEQLLEERLNNESKKIELIQLDKDYPTDDMIERMLKKISSDSQ